MLDNISQLKKLDQAQYSAIVQQLKDKLPDLEKIWQEPYPEYASAGLKVATLLNSTGEQENFDYHDCRKPMVTPLCEELSLIKDFLTDGNLQVMGARLLRLEPGTFLHEHRDFIYLEQVPRFRLHLPLITNDRAHIVSPDINVHFKAGYLWKLNPKETIHSACNFGSEPRIHLMIDCYVNPYLQDLIDSQFLDGDSQFVKPPLTLEAKETLMQEALKALAANRITQAEEVILGSFCRYDLYALAIGLTTYDLLAEFYDRAASEMPAQAEMLAGKSKFWQDRLVETYPERKEPALV